MKFKFFISFLIAVSDKPTSLYFSANSASNSAIVCACVVAVEVADCLEPVDISESNDFVCDILLEISDFSWSVNSLLSSSFFASIADFNALSSGVKFSDAWLAWLILPYF